MQYLKDNLWTKYKRQHLLVAMILVYVTCIYSAYTGEISFLFRYFTLKRGSKFYLWELFSIISVLIIGYLITRKGFMLKQEDKRVIVGSMMAIIAILAFLNF